MNTVMNIRVIYNPCSFLTKSGPEDIQDFSVTLTNGLSYVVKVILTSKPSTNTVIVIYATIDSQKNRILIRECTLCFTRPSIKFFWPASHFW